MTTEDGEAAAVAGALVDADRAGWLAAGAEAVDAVALLGCDVEVGAGLLAVDGEVDAVDAGALCVVVVDELVDDEDDAGALLVDVDEDDAVVVEASWLVVGGGV